MKITLDKQNCLRTFETSGNPRPKPKKRFTWFSLDETSGLATSYFPTNTLTDKSSLSWHVLESTFAGGFSSSLVSPTLLEDCILDSPWPITGDEGRLRILGSRFERDESDSQLLSGLFSKRVDDFASNSFLRFITIPGMLRGLSTSGESSRDDLKCRYSNEACYFCIKTKSLVERKRKNICTYL